MLTNPFVIKTVGEILKRTVGGSSGEEKPDTVFEKIKDVLDKPEAEREEPEEVRAVKGEYEGDDVDQWEDEDDEVKEAGKRAWKALKEAHKTEWEALKARHQAEREALKDEHQEDRRDLRGRFEEAIGGGGHGGGGKHKMKKDKKGKGKDWGDDHPGRGRGRGKGRGRGR